MKIKKLNEDCGCGGGSTPEAKSAPVSKAQSDPQVGKTAFLFDGRKALVNDSIKNSDGQTIGYVLNSGSGAYRVFKDKIQYFTESEGGMSTLDATIGMGNVVAPTSDHIGSGDKFPSLNAGTPAAKKSKAAQKKNRFTSTLMDFTQFSKRMKSFQNGGKSNKK